MAIRSAIIQFDNGMALEAHTMLNNGQTIYRATLRDGSTLVGVRETRVPLTTGMLHAFYCAHINKPLEPDWSELDRLSMRASVAKD